MGDDSAGDSSEAEHDNGGEDGFPVVGIGASAGGLAAFERLFEALLDRTGLAYVVVQHLAPERESELTSILQNYSSMPVEVIEDRVQLEPDHVYVLPAGKSLTIKERTLLLEEASDGDRAHISIDHFFQSLAEACREQAVAVVLSGTGSDGSRGLRAIKDRGGLTLVQSPDEADYPSMPQNAISTERVDLVLPVAELADRLANYANIDADSDESKHSDVAITDAYRAILSRLHSVTGHDFSKYKRSTVRRRIERRMQLQKINDLAAYRRCVESNREEAEALFDELLITVTEFFRDPEAFEALQRDVVPYLYENKEPDETIRGWVPGCATGEEVYSIAMLLWEEARRRDVYPDFKLFATDLDEHAIEQARRGLYSEPACAKLSSTRRRRFFNPEAGGFKIVNDLRDRVLFAVHDVLQDPPFARQDLVSCRNLLIYLQPEAQNTVFERLHYALRPGGRLFLGASESRGKARDMFATVDKEHRIYRPKSIRRKILPISDTMRSKPHGENAERTTTVPTAGEEPDYSLDRHHHRLLAEQYGPASVLVDGEYRILHVSGDAGDFLRIPSGEPTDDLLKTIRSELRLSLRTALVDAFEKHHTTTTGDVSYRDDETTRRVKMIVKPVTSPLLDQLTDRANLAQVIFEPVETAPPDDWSDVTDISADDEPMRNVVEKLEEENERLGRELRDTIERYETTTEELKTSNEELLTINEELQSTTEELETSKEELQSTNEELTTVNDELSHKVAELDDVNSDLKNLLSSTEIGTIFLDRELTIRRFTEPVRAYFNVLDTDLGRPIQHITHQLDYDELIDDVRRVLDDLQPVEREIGAENGDWYVARIHPYRTLDDRIDGVVVTFYEVTDRKEAKRQLARSELLFHTIFDRASDALFLFRLDEDGEPSAFTEVNEGACQRLDYDQVELLQMTLYDFVDSSSVDLDRYLHELRKQGEAVDEVRFETGSGELVEHEINSRLFTIAGERAVITVSRDISGRKEYERMLLEAKDESERLADLRASFLANMSHEIRTPLTSIVGVSQLLEQKDLPEEYHRMVELIRTSGRRLQQTLDSVLDISRLEAGEMNPTYRRYDVVSQVKDDVEMLEAQADRRGIELQFHSPDDELYFWTDAGFLNRIVYNLTENAIKFTDEGSVTVELERVDDELRLVVEDTGIGIDEDFLPHLFDKFKQASGGTRRDYSGSGLGLSLIDQLVELMGGEIDVESEKGEGTTFRVTIPEHRREDEEHDTDSPPEETK